MTDHSHPNEDCNPQAAKRHADPRVLVVSRYADGGLPHSDNAAVPLSVALTQYWGFDAHMMQYAPEPGALPIRWNYEHIEAHPYRIGLAFFDFDAHDLPPEQVQAWSETALAKLPAGFLGYRTAGGFRALTLLPEQHVISDDASWQAWHAFSAGLGAALSAVLGVQADKACTDPGRPFRLPNVAREGGKPCFPELYGKLGLCSLEPLPVEQRAAREISTDGEGASTLLGALFRAAGWARGTQGPKLVVRCPWAHEHNGGDETGTIVLPCPDGIGKGKFHCAHGNTCGRAKQRFTDAALRELLKLEAVQAEARHWRMGLAGYERSDKPGRMPAWAIALGAPVDPEHDPEPPGAQLAPDSTDPDEIAKAFGGTVLTGASIARSVLQPVDWISEHFAVAAGRAPTIAHGLASSGKTTFAQELAACVAMGRPFLGEQIKQGPVLHLDLEQGPEEVAERYKMLGVTEAAQLRVISLPRWRLTTDNTLALLSRMVRALSARLVVLDSLKAATPGVDENESSLRDYIDPLTALAAETGCAVLILHHDRKNTDPTARDIQAGRGTTAIADAAGTMLHLSKAKDGSHVECVMSKLRTSRPRRNGSLREGGKVRLVQDIDGLLQLDRGRDAELAALVRELPDRLTVRELAERVPGKAEDVRAAYEAAGKQFKGARKGARREVCS